MNQGLESLEKRLRKSSKELKRVVSAKYTPLFDLPHNSALDKKKLGYQGRRLCNLVHKFGFSILFEEKPTKYPELREMSPNYEHQNVVANHLLDTIKYCGPDVFKTKYPSLIKKMGEGLRTLKILFLNPILNCFYKQEIEPSV